MYKVYYNLYRREWKIIKGQILFNISDLSVGEKVKISSKREDLYFNEKVEVYELVKEKDGLYIRKQKNINFDNEIEFKEKVKTFFINSHYKEQLEKMTLTQSEKEILQGNSNEKDLIRKSCDISGVFENGIEFHYQNIVEVTVD